MHKQEINENKTWDKTWTLQKYKERKQEQYLYLKPHMTKYMINILFYRLKFKTIDLVVSYWFDGWTKRHW